MSGKQYVLILVLAALVALLVIPSAVSRRIKGAVQDSLSPFQNVSSGLATQVGSLFSSLTEARRAVEGRERMTAELTSLREQVRALKTLEQENTELRKLLGFKERHRYQLVGGEVIARGDAGGWWQSITINKGKDDGIIPDLAVITQQGLIGRTMDVSRRTATVLLVTDPSCRVSCRFTRTGAFGIVKGGGVTAGGTPKVAMFYTPQPCRMDFVSKDQKIFENDEVVTSGLGGVYPEGLLVGRVVRTEMDSSGLYQKADVLPASDLEAIRSVFVVMQ